jgi:hypothetical protein
MDLREFTSPSKTTKPWLNIVCNTLDANKITPTEIETNLLTLDNQVGVPNAPINATNLWSSGIGNLSQTDDSGSTVTYATTAFVGDYLPRDGSLPMTGDLDLDSNDIVNVNNLNTSGKIGIGKSSVAICPLEVVGLIISSDNGGASAKELFFDCNASGSSSLIQSYQQAVGVRDLNIVSKNLSLGTTNALSAGGGEGVVFLENASTDPVSDPVGGSLLYSSGGDLNCRSSSGVVVNLSNLSADAVLSDGNPSVAGNFPEYKDASGLLVGDSGVGTNIFRSIITGIADLANLSDGVASAGQRDLWQIPPGLTFNGGFLNYIESTNTLYSTDWDVAVGAQYSLDYGLTWNPCVFDVVPSTSMMIGYNGAGLWVALSNFTNTDFGYTSVDGVNFTSNGVVQPFQRCTNIIYSNVSNLFIAGQINGVNSWISTSPDGLVWTSRVTPDFTGVTNFLQLAQSSTTVVLVGNSLNDPVYSLDGGITWISGSGSPSPKQAVTWSETKGEFVAMGVSANIIRSSDGILWEDMGNGGSVGTVSVIWVDFPIARYYSAYGGADGLYNMASTIDIHLPFLQGTLDGSVEETQSYGSVVYIPQNNNFILSLDDQGIAYSTPRPLIVKALNSDMSLYPQYGTKSNGAVITNTVVETSLLSSGAGSLIIPANSMNLGSLIRIKFGVFLAALAALSTVVIRLRANGSQVWQSPVLTGAQVNQAIIAEIDLNNVDNANPAISSIFNQDGSLPAITSGNASLDYTINETFDLTAQFSVADPGNQIQMGTFNIFLMKF